MKKRDVSLDMLRGFGIILMVAGHMGWEKFDIYVFSFHMPLFYALSGYLFKSDDGKNFVQQCLHRFKRLMIPYYLFGILHYFIYLGFNRFQTDDAGELLINLLLFPTKGLPIAGALWFLASLFCTECILRLIKRVATKEWLCAGTVLFIAVCGFYLNSNQIKLPLGLETSLVGCLFLYVGWLLKRYNLGDSIKNKKVVWVILLTLLIPMLLLTYWNDFIHMSFGWYANEIVFMPVAIYHILFWWWIFRCGFKREKNSWGQRVLVFTGGNSMFFLAFNQLLIMSLKKVFHSFISAESVLSVGIQYVLIDALTLIITMISLYVGAWLTNKWKISRLWRS